MSIRICTSRLSLHSAGLLARHQKPSQRVIPCFWLLGTRAIRHVPTLTSRCVDSALRRWSGCLPRAHGRSCPSISLCPSTLRQPATEATPDPTIAKSDTKGERNVSSFNLGFHLGSYAQSQIRTFFPWMQSCILIDPSTEEFSATWNVC